MSVFSVIHRMQEDRTYIKHKHKDESLPHICAVVGKIKTDRLHVRDSLFLSEPLSPTMSNLKKSKVCNQVNHNRNITFE